VQQRNGFREVVPLPECRPRNQDEQKTRFEEEGDKQQASEQGGLPFGLKWREAIDSTGHVAIPTRFALELEKHRERA
jgi:hypothetical protein